MLHHPPYQPWLRTITTLVGSQFIFVALLILLRLDLPTANAARQPLSPVEVAATGCANRSIVPGSECLALVDLFTKTTGTDWLRHTNWLNADSGNAPCDWQGVTCNNGHVTELALASNHLSGTLPLSMGNLTGLTRLRLEKNALTGRIPPTFCNLAVQLTDASLDYNGFFTHRLSVERCLKTIDVDWLATQTVMVTDLQATEFTTNALRLAWTPIAYTGDGGYYEVAIATQLSGPYSVHGQTSDKSVATYLVDGLEPGRTYYAAVRTYTPAHNDQPDELWSEPARLVAATKATSGRVLVAAYFPADNDLAAEIGYVVERLRHGTALNPNVQVILLVDARRDGDTRVVEIADGQVTNTHAVEEQWGSSELDTADPAMLTWFLQYARNRFPAERTVVSLLGHGIPPAPEVSWATSTLVAASQSDALGGIPLLPKEHELTPSDVTDRGYVSTVDVGQALLAATNNGANPFDIVFFDQCFQGNIDTLYEVHKSARVLIASPNYAWLTAAYDKYLPHLTPTATPDEMAQAIITIYQATLDRRHPNSIFWVRSSDVPLIAEAISVLGDALTAATQAGQENKILAAVSQGKFADTNQCGDRDMQLGPPDELIGVETFSDHLQQNFGINDVYGVYAAADQLNTLMERVAKRTRTGNPYLAPDKFWDYRDTITMLTPLRRDAPSINAWRASIYRTDVPFTATWAISPTQVVTVEKSLAFAREGRWDDFLGSWYHNLRPIVGSWCHYTPPQQVTVEEPELISLTVAALDVTGAQLNWTPADDTSINEYRLYSKEPYGVSWIFKETVALTQTATTLTDLGPGAYRFRVLAKNPDNQFVVVSNDATLELATDANYRLYLPAVQR